MSLLSSVARLLGALVQQYVRGPLLRCPQESKLEARGAEGGRRVLGRVPTHQLGVWGALWAPGSPCGYWDNAPAAKSFVLFVFSDYLFVSPSLRGPRGPGSLNAKASELRGRRGRSPPQCSNHGGESIFSPRNIFPDFCMLFLKLPVVIYLVFYCEMHDNCHCCLQLKHHTQLVLQVEYYETN